MFNFLYAWNGKMFLRNGPQYNKTLSCSTNSHSKLQVSYDVFIYFFINGWMLELFQFLLQTLRKSQLHFSHICIELNWQPRIGMKVGVKCSQQSETILEWKPKKGVHSKKPSKSAHLRVSSQNHWNSTGFRLHQQHPFSQYNMCS